MVPRALRSVLLAAVLVVGLGGCSPALHVTYDREHCWLDGSERTVGEVEDEQARIAHHLLSRQPIQTALTVVMLLLAGAGYIDKLALLIAARRSTAPSFAERVRAALARNRPHPVRYFGIVSTGLVLIGLGAGCYVYLDADKRASERALQQLQFCHLALKGGEQQRALEQQRQNLDQLAATAGSIKSLVDALPPEAQRKAEAELAQMRVALGNQSRMLDREGEVAAAVQSGSAEIEKGLDGLRADVGGLKTLPERLRDANELLARVEARTRLDGAGDKSAPDSLGAAIAQLRKDEAAATDKILAADCSKAKLPSGKTIGETLADLASRPPPPAPVCKCEYPEPPARPSRSDDKKPPASAISDDKKPAASAPGDDKKPAASSKPEEKKAAN